MPRPPPNSTLFPYTTLFRSHFAEFRLVAIHASLRAPLGIVLDTVWRIGHHQTRLESSQHVLNRYGRGSVRTCWERSEEHTSELQSRRDLVCRLLLEKKMKMI